MHLTRCCQFTLGSTLMPYKTKEQINARRRELKQKRNNQWIKLVKTGITEIVDKHAYRGHVEVYRQIQMFMGKTGVGSSDVDSVVNWHELYDKWWEDFHLNAGHIFRALLHDGHYLEHILNSTESSTFFIHRSTLARHQHPIEPSLLPRMIAFPPILINLVNIHQTTNIIPVLLMNRHMLI